MGLGFVTTTHEFQSACELIEVRNIIVHNARYVSKIYLQHTGRTDLREGDLYPLTRDYITEKPTVFSKFVISLDSQIISHFKLIGNE